MNFSEQFWRQFWAIVGLTIVTFTAVLVGGSYLHTKLFVEHGYYDCTIPGSTGAKWCK